MKSEEIKLHILYFFIYQKKPLLFQKFFSVNINLWQFVCTKRKFKSPHFFFGKIILAAFFLNQKVLFRNVINKRKIDIYDITDMN